MALEAIVHCQSEEGMVRKEGYSPLFTTLLLLLLLRSYPLSFLSGGGDEQYHPFFSPSPSSHFCTLRPAQKVPLPVFNQYTYRARKKSFVHGWENAAGKLRQKGWGVERW